MKNLAGMISELELYFERNGQEHYSSEALNRMPEAAVRKLYNETFSHRFDTIPFDDDEH